MFDKRYEIFNDVPVTRDDLVLKGRRYLGIPYTKNRSVIWDVNGHLTGKLSCLGFCLRIAIDVGLLAPDFPINGVRYDKDYLFDDLIEQILAANFYEVAKEDAGPGDFFKMRYTDIDAEAPLHVAMQTTWESCPKGQMIHAINYQVGGIYSGSVVENRIDANENKRIISVHRLKGLVE